MMKVKIIWQGNAISCMKSFGKLNWIVHCVCKKGSRFCAQFIRRNGKL
jgi:hypothetical protein